MADIVVVAPAPAPVVVRPQPHLQHAGLTVEQRANKLRCLFREKLIDMRGRRGRAEAFRKMTMDFPVISGVQVIKLTKSSKDKGVKKRRIDLDTGMLVELEREDSSFIIGPIRIFMSSRATSFAQYVAQNGSCKNPLANEIGQLFYTWVDTLYLEYGLLKTDVAKPIPRP